MKRRFIGSRPIAVIAASATLSSAAFLATSAALAQPAPAQPPAAPTPADPWEATNRKLYAFDRNIDAKYLRPGVVFYHHATPTKVRHGLANALSNMTNPVIFFNDVLQLKPTAAAKTLARLVINSTIGIGGLFDVAGDAGLAHHDADFGETLGRYGVGPGPYIFLPVLGPTTVRDIFGRGVDTFADPLNTLRYDGRDELGPIRAVLGGVQARDDADPLLKSINATATDPYVTIRSLYLQNRASLVGGGASASSVQALPDFGAEPDATKTSAPPPAGPSASDAPPAPPSPEPAAPGASAPPQ